MAKAKSVEIVKAKQSNVAIQPTEDWEIALAKKATDAKAAEVVGTPRITHRGGVLKIDDKKVEGNKLKCVIVNYGLAKLYYATGFDPNAPAATPVCYAFASAAPGAEATMKPHDAAPEKQCETCAGCQHNRFGTAERGRGKRCSDTRKVMVMVGTEDPEAVSQAQVRQISIPPGSLRSWSGYLKSLDDITPYGASGVVTEIGTEPGEQGAYTLTFKATDRLDKEFVRAIFMKASQVEADLHAPFPVLDTEDAKPKKPAKKIKGQD